MCGGYTPLGCTPAKQGLVAPLRQGKARRTVEYCGPGWVAPAPPIAPTGHSKFIVRVLRRTAIHRCVKKLQKKVGLTVRERSMGLPIGAPQAALLALPATVAVQQHIAATDQPIKAHRKPSYSQRPHPRKRAPLPAQLARPFRVGLSSRPLKRTGERAIPEQAYRDRAAHLLCTSLQLPMRAHWH